MHAKLKVIHVQLVDSIQSARELAKELLDGNAEHDRVQRCLQLMKDLGDRRDQVVQLDRQLEKDAKDARDAAEAEEAKKGAAEPGK